MYTYIGVGKTPASQNSRERALSRPLSVLRSGIFGGLDSRPSLLTRGQIPELIMRRAPTNPYEMTISDDFCGVTGMPKTPHDPCGEYCGEYLESFC